MRATVVAIALAASVQVGTADAAVGDLTFNGCVGDLPGCTATTPAAAIDSINGSAISPDGKQLYTVSDGPGPGKDVSHFTVDSAGTPHFVGCIGVTSGCTSTIPADALNDAWGAVVSPDGKQLYTTSDTANNVSHFTLDGSGNPTFVNCIGDHPGCLPTAPVGALDNAKQPVISPDGKQLYVSSGAGALAHLTLDPSGTPTFVGCIGQVTACTPISPATALNGARFMALKADGTQLYVAAPNASALNHFSIDGSGNPTFVGCIGPLSGCATTNPANALSGVYGLAIRPDGRHLYVTSAGADAVSHLALDTSGNPTFAGCVGGLAGCTPETPAGAFSPQARGAVVTPDGTQLYTGGNGNNVAHFTLDASGNHTFQGCIGDRSGCTATSPANALDDPYAFSMSPDGKHLYSDNFAANNLAYFTIAGPSQGSTPSCTLTVQNSAVYAAADANAAAAKKKKKKKHPKGVIKLSATCNQAATLTLAGKLTATPKKKGKHKPKKKTSALAAGPVQAAAGASTTLTVKLSNAALKLLRKGAKESLAFTLTGTNANGTGSATATIARLKRKR